MLISATSNLYGNRDYFSMNLMNNIGALSVDIYFYILNQT
jgi:hypothetical protein